MLGFLTAIAHPQIDPVLISVGPIQIHWYGIAYVVGIMFGWWYAKKLAATDRLWGPSGSPIKPDDVDDFLTWAVIGIILGGRLGYVLFYDLPSYISSPQNILAIWNGGMSFHGGLAGTVVAMLLFARRRGFSPFSLFDLIGASCGIGILLGRIANFINSELYGAPTNVPWAIIFPGSDGLPRHPSQLYEGALEGLLVFVVTAMLVWRFGKLKTPGFVAGIFIMIYAVGRIVVEFVRVPDPQLGHLFGTNWITMGMLLSVPLLLIGAWSATTAKGRATK